MNWTYGLVYPREFVIIEYVAQLGIKIMNLLNIYRGALYFKPCDKCWGDRDEKIWSLPQGVYSLLCRKIHDQLETFIACCWLILYVNLTGP